MRRDVPSSLNVLLEVGPEGHPRSGGGHGGRGRPLMSREEEEKEKS